MDTGIDFIRPEFLNILLFQQKNLVIFPYVDLKHLHTLEIFTVGYNVIDLESTALHNLKEIIEFEANNSYSQNPTFFFIYNVDKENLKNLMALEGIRCIINSNENISDIVNGTKFIFFNKKNNQFLNYDLDESTLEFESSLIQNSQDQDILQEKIQKIKITANRIFRELNHSNSLDLIPEILKDYDRKYWYPILEFTSHYFDINIPDISNLKTTPRKRSKDYSGEYEVIITTNKAIGKEFIQLLHDYRMKKVNSAHLELMELYNPQKLYNYLRNHHWKDGVPQDFIETWVLMNISNYKMTEADEVDFETIFGKLNIHSPLQREQKSVESNPSERMKQKRVSKLPSIANDWHRFKVHLSTSLSELEKNFDNILTNGDYDTIQYISRELRELLYFFNKPEKEQIESKKSDPVVFIESSKKIKKMKEELMERFKKLGLTDWISLYKIKDLYRFVIEFVKQFDRFHKNMFGDEKKKDMPLKIKDFKFPTSLEDILLGFNRFRNQIAHHLDQDKVDEKIKRFEGRIRKTYFNLLSYLIKSQIQSVASLYEGSQGVNLELIMFNSIENEYFQNGIFSVQEKIRIRHMIN